MSKDQLPNKLVEALRNLQQVHGAMADAACEQHDVHAVYEHMKQVRTIDGQIQRYRRMFGNLINV